MGMIRMAIILVILFLAAPVTAADAAKASGASATQPTAGSSPPSLAEAKKTPPGKPSAKPSGEPSFFSLAYWGQSVGGVSRSEVYRNFGLAIIAFLGTCFAMWRAVTSHRQASASQLQAKTAHRQADIAEQGLITDRFSTAAEHLGSKELPVRLGGIYALWRLVQDSPAHDVISVIDILCAFVRDPPHEPDGMPAQAKIDGPPTDPLRPDVQTVLDLIGGKKTAYRERLPAEYRLNLKHANLFRANLTDAGLMNADLSGVDLSGANLTGAYLTGAKARTCAAQTCPARTCPASCSCAPQDCSARTWSP